MNPSEPDTPIAELAARYLRGDQAAFAALTQRYFPLVMAATLRVTHGQRELAEDAAQLVFIDLARRLPRLRADERLGGWLHQRAVRAAANLMRSERRSQARAAKALPDVIHLDEPTDTVWEEIAPLLDAELGKLSVTDRDAVLLRHAEGRDFRSVAAALGVSVAAAEKRVSRAMGKLRNRLLRHRKSVPAILVLASGLATDTAQAAGLETTAQRMATIALTKVGPITLAARWLPHLKAAALGSAAACVAWSWPIASAYRAQATAQLSIAPAVSAQNANPLDLPKFPPPPKMDAGLSVDEIVQRIAVLVQGPKSSLAEARFHFFSEELGDGRKGEALVKLRQLLSKPLLRTMDERYWRHYLLQGWATVDAKAALNYALRELPDDAKTRPYESLADAMSMAIHQLKGEPIWLAHWLTAAITDPAHPERRGSQSWRSAPFAFRNLANRIAHFALLAESREALEIYVTTMNEFRMPLLDDLADDAKTENQLELLAAVAQKLNAPKLRAELLNEVMEYFGKMNFERAKLVVEGLSNDDQRRAYSDLIAAPPHHYRPQGKIIPQEQYKPRADWWLASVPPAERGKQAEKIGHSWIDVDTAWGLQWWAQQVPNEDYLQGLRKLVHDRSNSFATFSGKNGNLDLPILVKHLRQSDSQSERFIDSIINDSQNRPGVEKLKTLLKP